MRIGEPKKPTIIGQPFMAEIVTIMLERLSKVMCTMMWLMIMPFGMAP